MIVGELVKQLQEFPQDARVVMFLEAGWSDIVKVRMVFGDFVALMNEDTFGTEE